MKWNDTKTYLDCKELLQNTKKWFLDDHGHGSCTYDKEESIPQLLDIDMAIHSLKSTVFSVIKTKFSLLEDGSFYTPNPFHRSEGCTIQPQANIMIPLLIGHYSYSETDENFTSNPRHVLYHLVDNQISFQKLGPVEIPFLQSTFVKRLCEFYCI